MPGARKDRLLRQREFWEMLLDGGQHTFDLDAYQAVDDGRRAQTPSASER